MRSISLGRDRSCRWLHAATRGPWADAEPGPRADQDASARSALGLIESIVATGPLHEDTVSRWLEAHRRPLFACYRPLLIDDSTAGGHMNIELSIEGKRTSRVRILGDVNPEALILCVADALERITWPQGSKSPSATTQVAVEYVFSSAGEPPESLIQYKKGSSVP